VFAFFYLAVIGVICVEVVMRYVFNSPTVWAQESMQYLSGVTYMMGGAYTLYAGAHVKMEILYQTWSRRRRAIVDLLTFPAFLIFAGVLFWKGWQFAWASILLRETTFSGWAPPIYPVKATIPIGCLLLLLQGVAKFCRDISVATGGESEH